MTKVPIAGNVKTRLQPSLTVEESACLAECFLHDTLSKISSLKVKLLIAYSPAEKRDVLEAILTKEQTLIEQKAGNLGDKIFHAFEFAFSTNSDAVVVIGTDSPTFPGEFINQAFERLEESDAVLGATSDGGFYLIGLRKSNKRIFENVEWSSPRTFEQTRRNIESLNLSLSEIPVWYDVDLPEDLAKLKKELTENPQIAPRTQEFVSRLKIF